jgi:hypothetical protein
MTLMTVNNHDEQGKDHRSQPRWSGLGKKMDAVLRLLRGESLEALSRELRSRRTGWPPGAMTSWPLASRASKGQRSDRSPDDRALKQAERKIGQLTMEYEVLRAAAEKKGAADPAGEAAQIAMDRKLPLAMVCRVLGASRSTISARRGRAPGSLRPGPATRISDVELVRLIRRVLADSPFAGEGYRKVRARLRRQHQVQVSGKRVLRLLRQEGLLAPQRARGRRKPCPHDSRDHPPSTERAVGHRCHHGLDPGRRLGVGVRCGRSLHRRGVGARGQGR